MADLFTQEELETYMQVASLDAATVTLAHDLATFQIRAAAGTVRYDSLTDVTVFKALALELARRSLLNPTGVRSEQIGGYSVTYATETVASGMTSAERDLVRRLAGVRSSFEVRLAAEG